MKQRIIIMAAVVGICAAVTAGDVLAAGRGPGGRGQGAGTCVNQQGSTSRPAGSQRRDGTFMKTGTTANGSTTRPGNGNGLRDGSGRNQNVNQNTSTTTAQ